MRINFKKSIKGQRPNKDVKSKITPRIAIQLIASYERGKRINMTPNKALILLSTSPMFLFIEKFLMSKSYQSLFKDGS